MYIVLFVFLLISLIFLIFEHNTFLSGKIEKIFKEHQTLCILLFIISIFVAISLSTLVSNFEFLIKSHFFGILFILILLSLNNYCIIYGKHHLLKFGEFFCALGVSTGGSLGLVLISMIVSESGNVMYLFFFNAIFSFLFGIILCSFHRSYWEIGSAVAAFLINEFNIYSSQYKIVVLEDNEKKKRKREKKEILMYSQPFELSISFLKFIIFFVSLIIRFFKYCANCCCRKEKK